MGIITEYVDVKVNSTNARHFEKYGYEIPKKIGKMGKLIVDNNAMITVKVEHLPIESKVYIEYECEMCHEIYKIQYNSYLAKKTKGPILCIHCAPKYYHSGEKCHLWNPNLSPEARINTRMSPEYHEFTKKVLARDNYTCQVCKSKINGIDVHHLDGYNWCLEKRCDVTNGITLCSRCHELFHSIYGKGYNTKEQFIEWINDINQDIKLNTDNYNGEIQLTRRLLDIENSDIYNSADNCAKSLLYKNPSSIYNVCNNFLKFINGEFDKIKFPYRAKGRLLVWEYDYRKYNDKIDEYIHYIDYEKLKKDINKLVCVNYDMVFNDQYKASEYSGAHPLSILRCCRNQQRYAGTDENGTPLIWMFYNDYKEEHKTKEYLESRIKETIPSFCRKIICLDTLQVFDSIVNGMKGYGLNNASGISYCLSFNNPLKHAGTYNGIPLRWMYYDVYENLLSQGVDPSEYYNKMKNIA